MAATTNVTPGALSLAVQITTAAIAYITCPANSQLIIKNAVFTNVTGGALTVTAYRVAAAGSPGATNTTISAQSVAAGGTYLCPELINMVLTAGETLQCLASANTSINFTASGFVFS